MSGWCEKCWCGRRGLYCQLNHGPAGWPWVFSSLSFSFFICKKDQKNPNKTKTRKIRLHSSFALIPEVSVRLLQPEKQLCQRSQGDVDLQCGSDKVFFSNPCLLLFFPFCSNFFCHSCLKSLGRAMSFKCNLSHVEIVLRGSLRTKQCWCSSWFIFFLFQSTSKQLVRVNLQPVVCLVQQVVKRQSHPHRFWSETAYIEVCFNTQSYWMTYILIRATTFTS